MITLTKAVHIDSTTFIAKILATSTAHMVAAFSFFDPKFAKRTHLVLGTPDIGLES